MCCLPVAVPFAAVRQHCSPAHSPPIRLPSATIAMPVRRFKSWEWPTPVQLCVPFDANLPSVPAPWDVARWAKKTSSMASQSPWGATDGGGGMLDDMEIASHSKKSAPPDTSANIITVAYPAFNSSMSIKPCTLRVIRNELARGHAIVKAILRPAQPSSSEPRRAWEALFEPCDFFAKYPVYLRVCIRTAVTGDGDDAHAAPDSPSHAADHAKWRAFVSTRLIRFAESLHFTRKFHVHLHPDGCVVPAEHGAEGGAAEACYFIGLQSEQRYQFERHQRQLALVQRRKEQAQRRKAGVASDDGSDSDGMDSDSELVEPSTPTLLRDRTPLSPLPSSPMASRSSSPSTTQRALESTSSASVRSSALRDKLAPRQLSKRSAAEVAGPIISYFLATEVHQWLQRTQSMGCSVDVLDWKELPDYVFGQGDGEGGGVSLKSTRIALAAANVRKQRETMEKQARACESESEGESEGGGEGEAQS